MTPPYADYRCQTCGDVQAVHLPADESMLMECGTCTDTCKFDEGAFALRSWRRVWSPVGLGSVLGAGGSPGRQSNA